MRSRYGVGLVALAAGLAAVIGCGGSGDVWPNRPGLKIVASFAPLHCFALNVAGDDAVVLPLMTNNGPHTFSDTPQDAIKLSKADLFFINGLGIDTDKTKRLRQSLGQRGPKIVELGDAIPTGQLITPECDHDHDHAGHHHDHEADGHVWLGPDVVIPMIEKIRDTLKQHDPSHSAGFDSRAAEYVSRIQALLVEGKQLLADKKERKIVSFHESMSYFARAFQLEVVTSIERYPGQEPTPEHFKRVVALCQSKNVRLIAVEPQFPSNTSATALRTALQKAGIAAEFVVIDPLETAPPEALTPDFYERRMRENLSNLAKAMR